MTDHHNGSSADARHAERRDAEDRYVQRVQDYDGGSYGGVVGSLSETERALVIAGLYDQGWTPQHAARQVLRHRGLYPKEPDPRRSYGRTTQARAIPRSDRYGRI